MEFDGRDQLVRNVQRILGIWVDGIAGRETWRSIEGNVTGKNIGTTNRERIINVQRALKILDDGKDGKITWNSIENFLFNKTSNKVPTPIVPPQSKGYSETKKLSKQTNGQYSQKIKPQAIVLHHTSGNYEGSVSWTDRVLNEKGQRLYASYHCIIARDGRRTVMNEDDNRAYHAGASSFKGRSGLNMWSLGVAWERDTYNEPLTDAAIESALEYIIPRMKKWGITPDWVTDHRTVAPKRKVDIAPKEYDKFMKILRGRWNA
jgi:hypothetical protein